jgi:hypothetical protein
MKNINCVSVTRESLGSSTVSTKDGEKELYVT